MTTPARPAEAPLTRSEIRYLQVLRLGRLATIRPDGSVQINPVMVYYNPATATIDIGGANMASSRKFRNIIVDPRVSVVVDDMVAAGVRCLEIRGHAEALRDPVDSAARAEGPIIRIHPARVISFGVDSSDQMSRYRRVADSGDAKPLHEGNNR
ncbi:PPOX class F420-dependent oxidoreductase [Nocardia sp. NBC_00511]|uniref:PPOX class F420-dependent oxidoreductase n=1 Tax=Nocardia sp. NBC_00511 TaxID=2903591 RepID=UPI002F90FB7D